MVTAAEVPRLFIEGVALALEVAAAIVIVAAGAVAFARVLLAGFKHESRAAEGTVRHDFGRSLLLALDFAIGSDVLKVAIVPTLDAALVAGVAILARVVLTFVLEYELTQAEQARE